MKEIMTMSNRKYNVGEDALVYDELTQGSDEWFEVRAGKITASPIQTLMVKGKDESGFGAGAMTYLKEKLAETFTGTVKHVSSPAMQWGHDHEDEARAFYEASTGNEVDLVGAIVVHDKVAVSPDGLVGTDGLVEIKNPYNTEKILDYHLIVDPKDIPKDYYAQIQMQLWATDRQWCDNVYFDTRYKRPLCMKVVRVPRDEEYIENMVGRIDKFIDLMEDKISMYEKMYEDQD